MKVHRTVVGRDAHPVAVVAYAGDHPPEQVMGVQAAGGDVFPRGVGGSKAKHIGGGDDPGSLAGAHDVPENPAAAGHGAPVRLNGRR